MTLIVELYTNIDMESKDDHICILDQLIYVFEEYSEMYAVVVDCIHRCHRHLLQRCEKNASSRQQKLCVYFQIRLDGI